MLDRDSQAAARLTSLYDAHAADAFRYALHLTGRREDAEDVVQHVFLQAYATLQGGHELMNPRAWLTKATKHRSLNLIRDRRDTPSAEIDPPAPFAANEGEVEALADVRAALWSLPEPQHHAFVLRHWSGLSQDEIADVLSTTPGAVESLLVRARATLVAEREEGHTECAGVRGRLARMLAPTSTQAAHLAGCRRCRTAQTRLLRAAEFATTFALVPGPQVLHTLSAAIPGFGACGAAAGAGASATGAAAGTGSGGVAASTVSAATKAGILTKVALAATTAAVAVTAVHPLRTAVTHAIFHPAPARSAAPAPTRPATPTAASTTAGSARADATAPAGIPLAPPATGGSSDPTTVGTKTATAPPAGPPAKTGGGKGKSGTAGSNGNGGGASNGATHGKSGSAPGRTKAAGGAATGKGKAGASNGKGTTANGAGPSKVPGQAKPTGGGPAGGNGNGNGNGSGNAGGNGNGDAGDSTSGNAGGNGTGNGKP